MRPTKLDDLVAQRLVDAVKAGLPWSLAAEAAGIGWSTLKQWKARGRQGEEPFAALLARLKRASGEAALEAVKAIRLAGEDPRHWTARAWWLERRFPKSFALRRPVPETAAPAAAGRFAAMSEEQLLAEEARIRERTEDGMSVERLESECQRIKSRIAVKAGRQ